jgi:F0F1-type ATP synthase membrane subunit b/b'
MLTLGESSAIPFSLFDKGVTVAVLTGAAWAAVVLARRWLKAMDSQESRDKSHLDEIKTLQADCHTEQMKLQKERIERDERDSVILEAISQSLNVIKTELSHNQNRDR